MPLRYIMLLSYGSMRTTIRVADDLLIEAKKLAAETNRTLGSIIESALRDMLARRAIHHARGPTILPTYGAGGILPGVDLDDGAALLDLMEAAEAVDRDR